MNGWLLVINISRGCGVVIY